MAKKNRAPRPIVDEEYLHPGDIIPGTKRIADHDGWYYPWKYDDFKIKDYRQWVRERQAEWEAQNATATPGGAIVFPIP